MSEKRDYLDPVELGERSEVTTMTEFGFRPDGGASDPFVRKGPSN